MPGPPAPVAFPSPDALRAWLERHHATHAELIVWCCRARVRHKGVTYAQALDEALCFGWIDGVRRAVDDETFTVRFTPRTDRSRWSAVNVRHVERLEAEGRMREPVFWVMQGKRAETRDRRFASLLSCSERGVPVPPLARPTPKRRGT